MNTTKGRFRYRLSWNFDLFSGKKIIRQLVLTFISFILLNLNAKAQKTIDTTAIVNNMAAKGNRRRIQRLKVNLSPQYNSVNADIGSFIEVILADAALKRLKDFT